MTVCMCMMYDGMMVYRFVMRFMTDMYVLWASVIL